MMLPAEADVTTSSLRILDLKGEPGFIARSRSLGVEIVESHLYASQSHISK